MNRTAACGAAPHGSLPPRRLTQIAIAIGLTVLILLGSALGSWWAVRLTDREMRDRLLLETRLLDLGAGSPFRAQSEYSGQLPARRCG